jgi:hypothetical protein
VADLVARDAWNWLTDPRRAERSSCMCRVAHPCGECSFKTIERAISEARKPLVDLLQRGPATWDCYCDDVARWKKEGEHSEDRCFPCAARKTLKALGEEG